MGDARTRICEVFRHFDEDGDGLIHQGDLLRVLRNLDPHCWSDERLSLLLGAAGFTSDCHLRYEDFVTWICGEGLGTHAKAHVAKSILAVVPSVPTRPEDEMGLDEMGLDEAPVWTRCQTLSFEGLRPGGGYSLPLFLHHRDIGGVLVTDEAGRPLPCCHDLVYEAVDHSLWWIDYPTLAGAASSSGWEVETDVGWAPWLPEVEFLGEVGEKLESERDSLKYTAVFISSSEGVQENTKTQKKRRIQRCQATARVKLFHMLEKPCQLIVGKEQSSVPCHLQVQQPESVLLLADYFHGSTEDVRSRWKLQCNAGEEKARADLALDSRRNYCGKAPVDISEPPPLRRTASAFMGSPLSLMAGQALLLPTGTWLTRAAAGDEASLCERLHLRAHFYDSGEGPGMAGHWLGLVTSRGIASVGLSTGLSGEYSYLHGDCPDAQPGKFFGWKRSFIDRSQGWHLFEIILSARQALIFIDGEGVSAEPMEGSETEACVCEVRLVSRYGGVGVWAGVELLHTPEGEGTWDVGIQSVYAGDRLPWQVQSNVEGQWQADRSGVLQPLSITVGASVRVCSSQERLETAFEDIRHLEPPHGFLDAMQPMLGKVFKAVRRNHQGLIGLVALDPATTEDGLWWFPASVLQLVRGPERVLAPVAAPQALEPPAVSAAALAEGDPAGPGAEGARAPPGAFAVECWSIPDEKDLDRMQRVVAAFVQALTDAGVELPNNIERIDRCPNKRHAGCYVYSFGSRRLHVATRVTQGGRLLLVVRTGGGFMDFIDFARRHGSLEKLRLERQVDRDGRHVARFVNVMSNGQRQLKQSRSPTSPSGTAQSFFP